MKAKDRKKERIELKVNGRNIEMNRFVSGILSGTIIAMVKSLRGTGKIKEVTLKIKK